MTRAELGRVTGFPIGHASAIRIVEEHAHDADRFRPLWRTRARNRRALRVSFLDAGEVRVMFYANVTAAATANGREFEGPVGPQKPPSPKVLAESSLNHSGKGWRVFLRFAVI